MILGTFTKHEDGSFTGTVETLLTRFDLEYRPIERVGQGPDYRVYRQGTEIEVGAAWVTQGKAKLFLDTKIDTPELSGPFYPALVQEEDGTYPLKWSRPTGKKKSASHEAEDSRPAASDF